MHVTKLLLAVLPALLMSCMKYQYATLSSQTQTNDRGEFIIENDTLLIAYSFAGANCPIGISIHNKLATPLYVDWKRSAVIVNDHAFNYWNDKATVNAFMYGSQIHWTNAETSTISTVTGEINRDESISFIPPKSVKQVNMLTIRDDFFELPNQKRQEHLIDGLPVKVLKNEFTKYNSPFKYRSYLTVSADPAFNNPYSFEDEFWVSDVLQTVHPPSANISNKKKANTFHTSKSTGFGTFLGVTGVIALIALLAVSAN